MEKLKAKNVFSGKGQSLVELLITIGIAAVIFPAVLTGIIASRNGKAQAYQRTEAVAILKQTQEIIRIIRENSWATFATSSASTIYHPVSSGNTWYLASGSGDVVNGITRQIVINNVYRDASTNAIVSNGGILDPSTKKIVTTASWGSLLGSSISMTSYITRYLNNLTRVDTTFSDFSSGNNSGTTVATTSGTGIPNDAQVQLGAGGGGDWCNPGTSVLATYDLPGQGAAQSISATTSASQDIAYTTTGDNSSGDAVDGLTISHASPPVIANPSKNTEAKAYGIYVDNNGSYVYFNENSPPNHTVRIANASNLSDVGYFDVFHTTGQSIYISGNTGYVTAGSTLYSFDVTSKTGSRPQLGSVGLAGTGNRVIVIGTNAYVATSSTTSQLQIINVSNPSNMTITKSINIGNGQGGVDVFVNTTQTYAYLVTSYVSGKNDFYIIDLTNTSNKYGYATINGMNPKGITVVPGNKAVLVGSGGEEYEVFDITSPNAASHCGGMSPSGVTTITAVASVVQSNGNAFSYIITNNSSAEFQVIAGGPGGQFATAGIFTSRIFDATSSAAFNYFLATIAQPSQTNLQFQVASAVPVGNSCLNAIYNFIGPSGSSSAYFIPTSSTSAAFTIPFGNYNPNYQNPAECFRYKAYFNTSDYTKTPVLYDATINYSP